MTFTKVRSGPYTSLPFNMAHRESFSLDNLNTRVFSIIPRERIVFIYLLH